MNSALDLKYILFFLFSPYGDILEIYTKRNNLMRGQAFIIFRDLNSATQAKQSLDGNKIFGKPMVILCKKENSIFKDKI